MKERERGTMKKTEQGCGRGTQITKKIEKEQRLSTTPPHTQGKNQTPLAMTGQLPKKKADPQGESKVSRKGGAKKKKKEKELNKGVLTRAGKRNEIRGEKERGRKGDEDKTVKRRGHVDRNKGRA